MPMHKTKGTREQVLVAGGGLAGAAAACLLAASGTPVVLFERETTPVDKICGEFLSSEAQQYLERLGLPLAAMGGHPITHFRLVRSNASIEVALPFRALGLSRRTLDAALLDLAVQRGAEVRRGIRVQRADDAAGLIVETSGFERLNPATLFLATGKQDMRGLRRNVATLPEDLVGFKTYFKLAPEQSRALSGRVEVMLFDQGYAGLQSVEGNRANLCLLVDRSALRRCGGNWEDLLGELKERCDILSLRLSDAEPLLEKPISIFRVPYGFVHQPSAADHPDVFRLGDQVAVIPSFTGDGMSIALHSAAMAVDTYQANEDARAYHERLRRDVAWQIARAGLLYRIGRKPTGQRALLALARVWPGALRLAAASTRIPARALVREYA